MTHIALKSRLIGASICKPVGVVRISELHKVGDGQIGAPPKQKDVDGHTALGEFVQGFTSLITGICR